MEWISFLIQFLLALFLGVQTTSSTPQDISGTIRSYTHIENVDALVMESFPARIQLNITGSQPDGCDLPVIIEQERSESKVQLEIYRLGDPAMMCAAILIPYRETIILDGSFEPGKYTIAVNDYTLAVEI